MVDRERCGDSKGCSVGTRRRRASRRQADGRAVHECFFLCGGEMGLILDWECDFLCVRSWGCFDVWTSVAGASASLCDAWLFVCFVCVVCVVLRLCLFVCLFRFVLCFSVFEFVFCGGYCRMGM